MDAKSRPSFSELRKGFGFVCRNKCSFPFLVINIGELKKKLAEPTGLHHEDQKLMYKKKERGSKQYLDVVGVRDGSKIVLVDDVLGRERRCLEMLKKVRIEKASKTLEGISSELDKMSEKVIFNSKDCPY